MNITQAIDVLVPGAKYGGYPRDQQHYEKLRWEDIRQKPAWEEIEVLLPQAVPTPPPDELALSLEDVERVLYGLGVTKEQIRKAKTDRGKPMP